jgi:hypothetical protein
MLVLTTNTGLGIFSEPVFAYRVLRPITHVMDNRDGGI